MFEKINHMASLDLFETYFVNSINYPKKKTKKKVWIRPINAFILNLHQTSQMHWTFSKLGRFKELHQWMAMVMVSHFTVVTLLLPPFV
jgi:hypothetical protein